MTVSRTELANAIRILAIDAVQKANSGHPGMPMGMADIAEVLWNDFLVHNPANPHWAGRDRFLLSNGHGSMLQYALLHLSGYDLSLDDIKAFRQWHSKTPGHPEYRDTPGVETTTGPLGQGLANGVGMALAENLLAKQFNRPGHEIVDNYTYVFLGDGCLMEGVSHEACSLAGVWGLHKLICFYDDNNISIDGHVDNWFADDTPARFEAYGWHVIRNINGHDPEAVKKAIIAARAQSSKPVLICCKTVIGEGSPNKAGTHDVHGAALGVEEVAATRKHLGWPSNEPFFVPQEIYQGWDARAKGKAAEANWQEKFAAYKTAFPKEAAEFERRLQGKPSAEFDAAIAKVIADFRAEAPKIATRVASGKTIQGIAAAMPEFLGGSADLSPSNNTRWKEAADLGKDKVDGNYIHYGVREFGMSAIMNGVTLYGGFLPFGGTFLIFSDYSRNAIRMSALMGLRVVYVMTHDSIGLGEDGPTHQPIEQVNSLRLIPNLHVWRPADAVETAIAWESSVKQERTPSLLALSRQNLPALPHSDASIEGARRGAYVVKAAAGKEDGILMASGSEVELALAAQAELANAGVHVRVVSMPCLEIFDAQDAAYRESVLPAALSKRLAVEAGSTGLWYKYVGLQGGVVGIDHFGASAPAPVLFEKFGFTVAHVVERFRAL
ncbi:transketolase [Acidithiobacillus sp. AMEEHan]|uniref:transketolase n=1 Tax=Acidithiobacillus sp. AMEEHan TaxID=2994951 RepID=UPI0027E5B897|nr:transketolase [Acidithiobacillus sp. AMEEHan]